MLEHNYYDNWARAQGNIQYVMTLRTPMTQIRLRSRAVSFERSLFVYVKYSQTTLTSNEGRGQNCAHAKLI